MLRISGQPGYWAELRAHNPARVQQNRQRPRQRNERRRQRRLANNNSAPNLANNNSAIVQLIESKASARFANNSLLVKEPSSDL
jgi:hypothetical protein